MNSCDLRPIPDFPGYSVTPDARIWSHPKSYPSGKRGRKHDGIWLRTWNCAGQPVTRLSRDGAKLQRSVRRLAEQAWGCV